MSVDLTKAKVGDKVVFRDGRGPFEIVRVGPFVKERLYPIGLYLNISDQYPESFITFTENGFVLSEEEPYKADIVELIPAEEVAPTPTEPLAPAEYVSPTGAKRNSVGKAPLGFFPLDLCEGAAKVMQYGAVKYTPGNFRKGFPPVEALHSLMRHVAAVQAAIEASDKDGSAGLLLDPESEQAHIHHVVTSALILVQSMKKEGWKV